MDSNLNGTQGEKNRVCYAGQANTSYTEGVQYAHIYNFDLEKVGGD